MATARRCEGAKPDEGFDERHAADMADHLDAEAPLYRGDLGIGTRHLAGHLGELLDDLGRRIATDEQNAQFASTMRFRVGRR